MEPFKLKIPVPEASELKQPIIRLKPCYYQILISLKAKTGLPLGNIVEQCIDYALSNMEDDDHACT